MRQRNRLIEALALALALTVTALPASSSEDYSLDMRDTDLSEFIATIGELTGKTIVIDPRVKGKITIRSPRSVTQEELYEIFLVQLGVSGFAVVDVGDNILKVIPQQAVKLEGVEVQGAGNADPRESENVVTRVVQVNNVDVAALVAILRPLVDNKTGIIAPYPASNVILITDRESNVRRLLDIINRVDTTDSKETEVVRLKNASAQDLSQTLTTLLREQTQGENRGALPTITADKRTNSLVIRADGTTRDYLLSVIRELDSAIQTDNNTRVHYLKYAKAGELVSVLESIGSSIIDAEKPDSAPAGTPPPIIHIKAHEPTNSIVMSGSPQIIRSLNQIIEQLDIRRAQVLVEAVIVEMSDARAKELGVQWLFLDRDGDSSVPLAGSNFNNLGNGINAVAGAALTGSEDTLAGILAGVEGLSLGVGQIDGKGLDFAMLIKALQNDRDSNILSTPSLVTMDNQEASILVGSEVPIVTGQTVGDNNSNPFQTINRQDIGIKLKVTPQVNEGSAVQLKIEQEVSSLSGVTAADIILDKREIKTSVMVDDNATIVLGGLIDDDVQESTSKVPGLGSIPVLGRLFRSDSSRIARRNLMVFIRPSILRDAQSVAQVSGSKYGFIRARQLMDGQRKIELFTEDNPAQLPEWTGMGPTSLHLMPPQE
ncbi:type II secretion system secretin GspD [Motiliproteus sp. SC1-56]|uniref:type II secretion system secretin GspD n=1 Tax=Motiliproteus sp. SC1-56 TaxID=2799565 RepID=UPI001F5CF36F|nr:type II secretion system secretin GspD [Motiliproteus sp. SC1-56]